MREKLIELYREAHRKAHDHCNNIHCHDCEYEALGSSCIRLLKADYLLASGVVVREKGEWEHTAEYSGKCNVCGFEWFDSCQECGVSPYDCNFCPNCGADMRRRKEKR